MHPYAWPVDAEALSVPVLVIAYASLHASRRLLIAFTASQLLLLGVFATPLHTLAVRYLVLAHFLQNVIVAEWAPALFVVAIPRRAAQRIRVNPLVALPLWLANYFLWHVPSIYDAALRHPHSLLHLEHASYFVAGCALWWPVFHGRYPAGAKALYLFAAFVLGSPLGLLLALLPNPVYSFYSHAPVRVWGLSRLADQQIAGLTMAIEQAVVFFTLFVVYLARFMRHEAIAGTFGEIRR